MNKNSLLIELLGWYGTAAIMVAYALVSFSFIEPTNVWYQILNGTGSLGILVVSFYKRVYQSVLLNFIWAIIAAIAILRII